jgi:Zn-dependent protease with chaperone function
MTPDRPGIGDRGRWALLVLLLALGAALMALLGRSRPTDSLAPSLALPFQLLGTPVHLVDRLASRMVPVGSVEERDLGETLRRRYDAQVRAQDPSQIYLDRLMPVLRRHTRRPFPYRAYLIGTCGSANALALPGGLILVCDELLATLKSESELVAVLAHEVGHIELAHTFDKVRFQLLARRTGSASLGELADGTLQLLVQSTYSQAAEHEADDYAFDLLSASAYDPAAVGRSFASLLRATEGQELDGAPQPFDLLGELARSHPPTTTRLMDYRQRGLAWWSAHPNERRYVGRANLTERKPMAVMELPQEWVMGGEGSGHATGWSP